MTERMSIEEFRVYLMERLKEDFKVKLIDDDHITIEDVSPDKRLQPVITISKFYDNYLITGIEPLMDAVYEDLDQSSYKWAAAIHFKEKLEASKEEMLGMVSERLVPLSSVVDRNLLYEKYLDMAIIYDFRLDEAGEVLTSSISNDFLANSGISANEIKEAAKRNREPGRMYDMLSVFKKTFSDSGLTDEEFTRMLEGDQANIMFILASGSKYGATVLLDKDYLRSVADKLGGDIYILPSSKHEVIVIKRDTSSPEPEELAAMVREVNLTTVSPDDKLTDSVYMFNSKKGEIEIAVPSPTMDISISKTKRFL